MTIDIGALNVADEGAAVQALGPLFEGAPSFLSRLVAARPFAVWEDLFRRAREIARGMPETEQIELIDAHPRLGAPPASVSPLSFREQGYDRQGLEVAAEADELERQRVAAELERLNAAYEARFGFRYCVNVAGRPRAALLPEMDSALWLDRDVEIQRALDAVVDIARTRFEVLSATR